MSNQVALRDQDGFWILKRKEVQEEYEGIVRMDPPIGAFRFIVNTDKFRDISDLNKVSEYTTEHNSGGWQHRMWEQMHDYVKFTQQERPFAEYEEFNPNLLCIFITSKAIGVEPIGNDKKTKGPKQTKALDWFQDYDKYGGYDIFRTPKQVKKWTDNALDIYYNPKTRSRYLNLAKSLGYKRVRVVFKAMLIYPDLSYTTIAGNLGKWMKFFSFQCAEDTNEIILRKRAIAPKIETDLASAFPNGYCVSSHKPTREDYEREG